MKLADLRTRTSNSSNQKRSRLACIWLSLLAIALLSIAANLNRARFQNNMANAPSDIQTTTTQHATPTINLVLGGFRGILADWLWIRSMILQEQGRFVEIVQLAEWITALQPQFTDVWTLHAWNLAYNIPVLLPNAEERWRWVRHGYEILRDQAAPTTNFDAGICSELAWILMHKIAGTTDEYSDTYFANWVAMYTSYLEPNGRLPLNREAQQAFAKISGIPASMLTAFEMQFGTHDWRHPLTHAAAWAYTGLTIHPDAKGATRTARMLQQTYFGLFLNGNIQFDENGSRLLLLPDLERAQGMLAIVERNRTRNPSALPIDTEMLLLERMIQILAQYRQNALAEYLFTILQERFPNAPGSKEGIASIAQKMPPIPVRQIQTGKSSNE